MNNNDLKYISHVESTKTMISHVHVRKKSWAEEQGVTRSLSFCAAETAQLLICLHEAEKALLSVMRPARYCQVW